MDHWCRIFLFVYSGGERSEHSLTVFPPLSTLTTSYPSPFPNDVIIANSFHRKSTPKPAQNHQKFAFLTKRIPRLSSTQRPQVANLFASPPPVRHKTSFFSISGIRLKTFFKRISSLFPSPNLGGWLASRLALAADWHCQQTAAG
jgi:hypothetical protein